MADITVCIPAYRSEPFIHKTLRSVHMQSYRNIAVEIAIEPPGEETWKVCQPFLDDPRFNATFNADVLGWDCNIKGLLKRVRTPFFMILPHDDILHPEYIETLLSAIYQQPQASVAYADMYIFGHGSFRKWLSLQESPLAERLLSFFLGGAEAVPWRGVTRAEVLSAGASFPTNEYSGFAVECEWALHLLLQGAAHRVARPLYFKRSFAPKSVTVSSQWGFGFAEDKLRQALEHHRTHMHRGFQQAPLSDEQRRLVTLACEAAMLRRYMAFSSGRFAITDVHSGRAEEVIRDTLTRESTAGARIRAMVMLAMSHDAVIKGNPERAETLARTAVETDPLQWEGLSHLSRLLLRRGRGHEALEYAIQAWEVAPHAASLKPLLDECSAWINQAYSSV